MCMCALPQVEGVKSSCWSKYLESKVDKVLQEEPEEEENVYTDREDFTIFRNAYKTISRYLHVLFGPFVTYQKLLS